MRQDHRWLENWLEKINNLVVLELGCGEGIDTRVIAQHAKSVVACDKSPLQSNTDVTTILKLDHSENLPFNDHSYDLVIASLCLHYFDRSTSNRIVAEISRVLKNRGVLLCRLNSVRDVNYGATGYPEIETGVYNVEGEQKRFFSERDIRQLFPDPWVLSPLVEKSIDRYGDEKVVWEFTVTNG
jgi:SAM-dependent methyltransferase